MLKLDDFKKLCKSEILNTRFIYGGGVATQSGTADDYAHTFHSGGNAVDQVVMSGHIKGGAPLLVIHNNKISSLIFS